MAVKWIRVLTNAAIMLALMVILMGGWTRINQAGLSCPDWPGCYGEWVLPLDEQTREQAQARYPLIPLDTKRGWIEMLHRYMAGSLGLLIMMLALGCFYYRREIGLTMKLPLLLVFIVIAQGLFGMFTVTLKLWPQIVTLHLLGGVLTLTGLVLLRQKIVGRRLSARLKIPKLWVSGALVLLLLQITLGGWTSSNYAGWSCGVGWSCLQDQNDHLLDFKSAFDISLPTGQNYQGGALSHDARAAIQFSHRLGALLLSLYLITLTAVLFSRFAWIKPLGWMMVLLLVQLMLGGANVVWGLRPVLALAHQGGSLALLLCLLWLYDRVCFQANG